MAMGEDDLSRTLKFKTSAKHRIIATFRKWDENGDGVISEPELTKVLTRLGMTKEAVSAIWHKIDKDNSGGIAYVEFVEWLFGTAARDLPEHADEMLWQKESLSRIIKEATTGDGETALHLLRQDKLVDVNSVDEDGTTILMAASKGGQLNLVEHLLDVGFSGLNATDNAGNTALDYAVSTGHRKVQEFMEVERTAHDNTVPPAIRSLFPSVLRGDVEATKQSALPRVSYTIYIDRHLNTYLSLNLLPCAGSTLLIKGIEPGLVKDWNDKKPNLSVKPGDHIVEVNELRGDARVLQTELGKFQEMNIVLERYWPELGFDPNACDERGTSMLHHAVRSRKGVPMVKALLSSLTVEVNKLDRHGRTPLDLAEEKGDDEMVDLLKLNGAKSGDAFASPKNKLPP